MSETDTALIVVRSAITAALTQTLGASEATTQLATTAAEAAFGALLDVVDLEGYRILADHIIEKLNPHDDDIAEVAILIYKLDAVAEFIESIPCECPPGAGEPDWDEPACKRCEALGRAKNKAVEW